MQAKRAAGANVLVGATAGSHLELLRLAPNFSDLDRLLQVLLPIYSRKKSCPCLTAERDSAADYQLEAHNSFDLDKAQ